MANIKRVSPAEAKKLVDEGWLYLDVRTEPEYAAGHPTGAQNVPVMKAGPRGMAPNAEFIEGRPCPYKPCSDYCHFSKSFCIQDLTEEMVWPRVERFVQKNVPLEAVPA